MWHREYLIPPLITAVVALTSLSLQLSYASCFCGPAQSRLAMMPTTTTTRTSVLCAMLEENDENSNIDDDDEFYKDLRKAKIDALGLPIPPDLLKASAEDSQNEFLKAMKEVSEEFESAKEELGSDGACDIFLGKIREEDERREAERRKWEERGEEEDLDSFQ